MKYVITVTQGDVTVKYTVTSLDDVKRTVELSSVFGDDKVTVEFIRD